jgi:hypothetical protein
MGVALLLLGLCNLPDEDGWRFKDNSLSGQRLQSSLFEKSNDK